METKLSYKKRIERYQQAILEAKRRYFTIKISEAGNSTRELFKSVNFLAKPQQETTFKPDQALCNKLALFFLEKVQSIYHGFQGNNSSSAKKEPFDSSTSPSLSTFQPITPEEVNDLLLSVKTGSPLDPCPPFILHQVSSMISKTLTSLINQILKTGHFPETWKKVIIRPLLKKTNLDPTETKNYRPIAALPIASKILEKHLNRTLTKYLATNNLLDSSQHGFRSGHSTESALVIATEEIRRVVDGGGRAVLVLLDLSAAFDTVNHGVLVQRLRQMGLDDTALALLSFFLQCREQQLSWEGLESASFQLPCGVPQGSALSPTLFNIYVSPLAKLVQGCGFSLISYADDSQLSISIGDRPETTALEFHACLTQIMTWMDCNFLKINTEKTEVMQFGPGKSVWDKTWWPVQAGECPTPSVKFRNLGVVFDDKLTLAAQVNNIMSSCFFLLKMLKKIFLYISHELQKTVMAALLLSKLDYCNALFLGADKGQMNKLQSIQNAAARLLLRIPKTESVSAVLTALHWLPVKKRVDFKALCLVYRAMHGEGAEGIQKLFSRYAPSRNLRSASQHLIELKRFKRARWGGRAFSLCRQTLEQPTFDTEATAESNTV